jgi:hypothetical protein
MTICNGAYQQAAGINRRLKLCTIDSNRVPLSTQEGGGSYRPRACPLPHQWQCAVIALSATFPLNPARGRRRPALSGPLPAVDVQTDTPPTWYYQRANEIRYLLHNTSTTDHSLHRVNRKCNRCVQVRHSASECSRVQGAAAGSGRSEKQGVATRYAPLESRT